MTRKLLIAAICLTSTSAAFAQSVGTSSSGSKKAEKALEPPTPTKVDRPAVIVFYLLGIVIAGAGVGAMLIPSRRGHQD